MELFCSSILALLGSRHQKPARNLPVPKVLYRTPDDGQRRCPKHVEFYNRINIWIISASGRLFKNISITMHSNINVKFLTVVSRKPFGPAFEGQEIHIFRFFDPSRWVRYVVPKRRWGITAVSRVIMQNSADLMNCNRMSCDEAPKTLSGPLTRDCKQFCGCLIR